MGMSLVTMSNLATAGDLLNQIISDLDLKDPDGARWTGIRLKNMIQAGIEKGEGQRKPDLPIMSVVFRGPNPSLLKQIADKWAELFLKKNASFFSTEAIRSYDFLSEQYRNTERLFRHTKEKKMAFAGANPLETLKSQRNILISRYNDFLEKLIDRRATLVRERAKLASSERAIVNESPSLTLRRGISTEAVWMLLGQKMDTLRAEALPNLVISEQEKNGLYETLKVQVATTRIEVDTLEAQVADLEKHTEEFRVTIDNLDKRIAKIELSHSEFDREIVNLESTLNILESRLPAARLAKEEQGGFVRIVEPPVEPGAPMGPQRMKIVIKWLAATFLLSVGGAIVAGSNPRLFKNIH